MGARLYLFLNQYVRLSASLFASSASADKSKGVLKGLYLLPDLEECGFIIIIVKVVAIKPFWGFFYSDSLHEKENVTR